MLKDLVDKKANLWEQSKAILTKAEGEKRLLNTDEQTSFDKIHAEMGALSETIDRIRKSEEVEKSLTESRGRKTDAGPVTTLAEREFRDKVDRVLDDEEGRLDAMRVWLIGGSPDRAQLAPERIDSARRYGWDINQKHIEIRLSQRPMRRLSDADTWQYRAQGVNTGSAGLFTVPNEMMKALEQALLFYGGMRQVSTILRTDTGANLPIPMVNDTNQVGAILAENTAVATQDVTFTQLVLGSYKYHSKLVAVSIELMQDSSISMAQFLGEALGTRIGRITNTHFTTGTGTGQPNGIVTAATVGKQPATTQQTAILFDDLVDLEHSVDPAYRQAARWMMHDGTLKAIKKLKDSQGRPLYLPGLAVNAPDTILGYPYVINQDIAQMATTAKSVVFGALDKYIVRDVLGINLIRLDERYADLGQVAFVAFARMDGNLMNAGTNPVKYFQNSA